MENEQITSNRHLTFKLINDIPLVGLIEHSTLPWCIRDKESKHVYLNKTCEDFLSIPPGFSYEGKNDVEFPCKWSEFGQEFSAQDRKAESCKEGAEIISNTYYGSITKLEP